MCGQSLEAAAAWHVWGQTPWPSWRELRMPMGKRSGLWRSEDCMEKFGFFYLSLGELVEGFEVGVMGS